MAENAAATSAAPAKHRWRFFRAGGVDQVKIERGADIAHLDQLDQKLWVALSCPVKGLEFDERTLELLDVAKDGRVRPPEILDAVRWIRRVLKNLDELVAEKDGVPLASIDASQPEGKRLLASAKIILENLGRPDATAITVADAQRTAEVFKAARLNGDGIVPPDTIADPAVRKAAEDVVLTLGGAPDRSGKPGVDAARVEAFFKDAEAFAAWVKAAEDGKSAILPLGDGTAAAYDAVVAVKQKVDDYFARCRLAAYDPKAQQLLNIEEKRYLGFAAKDLTISSEEIRGLPLQAIEAGRPLELDAGVNPAWHGALKTLRDAAVRPLLGKDATRLTEADWATLEAKLAPYAAWRAAKAGASVEKLGAKRVRELLAGGAKDALLKACAEDASVQSEVEALVEVERLARYYRDLHRLLVNYVSFSDFYSRSRPAIFQAGTLYLDSRSCELCVRVDDGGRHGALAAMSRSYLAYCDCTRPSGEKMTIAAAFTAGDSDHLMAGRNGIFYDRKGRDWDVTITRIVDHPISIGQAFWAPYKRFIRWVEEQIAKRATEADAKATDTLTTTATAAEHAATTGAPPAPTAAPEKKMDIGVLAAISVAIGGISTAVGAAMNAMFGLGAYMPLGVLGVVLLISGPSMVIAWLKLRQRNLGPLLDANGWAVNGRVKVNIPLGASLTDLAVLPPGSERSLVDPFAETRPKWPRRVLWLLVFLLVLFGIWRSKALDKRAWYVDAFHAAGLDTRTDHETKAAAEAAAAKAAVEKK